MNKILFSLRLFLVHAENEIGIFLLFMIRVEVYRYTVRWRGGGVGEMRAYGMVGNQMILVSKGDFTLGAGYFKRHPGRQFALFCFRTFIGNLLANFPATLPVNFPLKLLRLKSP